MDRGADLPFAQAAGKLCEHDGVTLSPSTIRQVTEGHARALLANRDDEPAGRPRRKPRSRSRNATVAWSRWLRSTRTARTCGGGRLLWKEARLSLAHAHGSTTSVYGATLGSGVEVAGRQLLGCAIAACLGTNSQVHALGDGAVWIADQVAARFGTHGTYAVDFFHVCDHLADAAKGVAPDAPKA